MSAKNDTTEIKPQSNLLVALSEPWDYDNGIKVSLEFIRYNSQVLFTNYRDALFLIETQEVQEAVKQLHDLADRLEKNCVKKVGAGHICPNCGSVFFNYTKRKKIYCRPISVINIK